MLILKLDVFTGSNDVVLRRFQALRCVFPLISPISLTQNHILGAQEVKKHPFYQTLHWDELIMHKAEFVPYLDSEEDTSYFDCKLTIVLLRLGSSQSEIDNVKCTNQEMLVLKSKLLVLYLYLGNLPHVSQLVTTCTTTP